MKIMKSILIATTLICASVVSTLSAQQEAQPAEGHQWKVAKGDSVMIKRECVEYLTGERPSVWVWDKVHTVYQLGTKRFPEGVLLMNIYSWICEECLIPVNGHAQEEAQKAATEQKDERETFEAEQQKPVQKEPVEEPAPVVEPEPAPQPVEQPVKQEPVEQPAPVVEPKPAPQPVEEPVKQEPVEQPAPVVEPKPAPQPVEEPVQQEPVEQPAPVVEPEPAPQPVEQPEVDGIKHEAAKGDSIKSEQKFHHGYDRFTIGLRGGASSLLHHSDSLDANWRCGGDVVLDLQYAHYWTKDGRPVDLGIIVGLGIGYQQSGFSAESDQYDSSFVAQKVDYSVLIKDIKETDHQLQLEVPVMFSLIHQNGLFFNVGPKFMIPVYTPYKLTASKEETHISAYFQETGITIQDNPVTGQYTGQQPTEKNGIQFNINVMLTAELGYEWTLNSGNSLGLGAYANYSVYNSFSNTTSSKGLFNLTAPTESSVAQLDVLSATHTYANKLGYFDAGIKIAYHFNFPKKMKYKPSKLE